MDVCVHELVSILCLKMNLGIAQLYGKVDRLSVREMF